MTLSVFLLLSLLVGGAAFIQGAVGIGFALIMAPVLGLVDATYLPVTLLIDRDGNEIARLMGGADWSSDTAKALIRQATAP